MEDTFSYFTRHPIDIGTIPTDKDNPPTNIENYDARILVNDDTFFAWGKVTYENALTQEQIEKYELQPSFENPILSVNRALYAVSLGVWEEHNKVPEDKRLTFRESPDVPFSVKKGVTMEALIQRYEFALRHEKVVFPEKRRHRRRGRGQGRGR